VALAMGPTEEEECRSHQQWKNATYSNARAPNKFIISSTVLK